MGLLSSLIRREAIPYAPGGATAPAPFGVRSTRPAGGSLVRYLPAQVTLTFAGRLRRVISVRVLDARGINHTVTARRDPRNAARVVVRMRHPRAGTYTVRWTVQAGDGHSAAGTFTFRASRR